MNRATLCSSSLMFTLGLACGGSEASGPSPAPVVVTVSPVRDTLTVGTQFALTATVAGTGDAEVTWTVLEGASGGTISATGEYTAGMTPGTYHVIASSKFRPESRDTATVLVVAAPNATISSTDSVVDTQAGITAGVPPLSGARYTWTVVGGTLTSGQGTQTITFTSGTPGTVALTCTVKNLADSAVTGTRQIAVVAGPVITSFSAPHDSVTVGTGSQLTAVFAHGTATVNQGIGAVTSGAAINVGPFQTAYVGTSYTLTVAGFRGLTRTATLTIVPVNPPVLGPFQPLGSLAPVGGRGYLLFGWNRDPGVVGSIQPGFGTVSATMSPIATPTLTTPGSLHYTITLRSPADSILTDTTTITAVTPTPGALTPTGSLVTARWGHTATLLADGRVLIAGGEDFVTIGGLRSTEIYDPAAGTFTPTDSLHLAVAAAVRLLDGRVLMVGQDSTEIYDPQVGKYEPGPVMADTGGLPVYAALLGGGRVLVVHGQAAEILDVTNNTTTPTGTMGTRRLSAGVISLTDGRVLIAGGTGNYPLSTAEIYDPASGVFSPTGSMNTPHWNGTYTRLADGRILVAGGYATFDSSATFAARGEIFDRATGRWTLTGPLVIPRLCCASATLRGDGTVALLGGQSQIGATPPYDEVFSPTTGLFTPLNESSVTAALGNVAVELQNGTVLTTGGARAGGVVNEARILQ